jgi:hypothetical protein
MVEKQILDEDKEKLLKAQNRQLDSLKLWKEVHLKDIEQAEKEIELKKKAPLKLVPEYEYETLPEWKEHMAKSNELAIKKFIAKIKGELMDIENQIEFYTNLIEKVK